MTQAYQLSNIKFFYADKLALSLPVLNIRAGKITALVGPNGCGKSTLLNLLAFLQKNQQGQICFFSQPVKQKISTALIKRVSFLPQKPYLLSRTVVDNLFLTMKFHHMKADYLKTIQLTLEKLGIAALGQQQAKTLSGGELQKVALARAIITQPEVLIMDEPFSCLDQNGEQLLIELMTKYSDDHKTLIFSTHDRLQGIAIADDVVSLFKGKLVKTPLLNLFQGFTQNQLFNTGKIRMMLTNNTHDCQYVSIDPNKIVLSREPLVSSIRNQFQGRVTAIMEEKGEIRVTVLAGEFFHVLITRQSLKDLDIALGELLWVSFKSNSILAF